MARRRELKSKWQILIRNEIICTKSDSSQCAPCIFNLVQKFHGLSCFWGIDIHETVQNQSRKTSVIRLPKFTTVNMARKCHQRASFSIENLFFEDYSIGSLMTDVFLDWFWAALYISMPQKQESPWNFWSRLKILGAHCDEILSAVMSYDS